MLEVMVVTQLQLLDREAELESELRAIAEEVKVLILDAALQREENLKSDNDIPKGDAKQRQLGLAATETEITAGSQQQPEPDSEEGDLFEGDLDIPVEMIEKYYDLDDTPVRSQSLSRYLYNGLNTAHDLAARLLYDSLNIAHNEGATA